LGVFDELESKLKLFKKIINSRFLFKQMSLSKDTGITFTTEDGQSLALNSLSSGEQHELILFYQLLFKVRPNSLVLLDEPEISLHVAWQKQFLQDILEVIRLAAFDMVIATHSPQIIADRWDLTVPLKKPEQPVSVVSVSGKRKRTTPSKRKQIAA
jgi:predicted ATP-binding protein involved in virulence